MHRTQVITDDGKARIAVVKIGGSVLSSSDWPSRLQNWLNAETSARVDTHFVLLVGGGTLVGALRVIDARTPLGDEAAHWAAIELMDVTTRIVARVFPSVSACDDFRGLKHRVREAGITMFMPARFMMHEEPNSTGTRLPATWDVTSDSIAARLAILLAADELVLIKSRSVQGGDGSNLKSLAAEDLVDRFLPKLTHELPKLRISTM